MKKFLFSSVLLFCAVGLIAQNGKVISTYEYLKVGDLANAKTAIDEAVQHEKTKTQAKTWFYYGNTYNAIARSEDNSIQKLDEDAGDKAIDGYLQALTLDTKGKYKKEIKEELGILKTLMVNQAITAFNKKGYEFALEKFNKAVNISETIGAKDTIALFYGAVSATQAGKKDNALELYQKCIDVACCGADVYVAMASIYREKQDKEALKTVVEQGRGKFPNNAALVLEQLNLQLADKNYEEAIGSISLGLAQTPDNKNLHFAMGMAKDFMGNTNEAIAAYQQALKIDANYFEANYNLGALYNNAGDAFVEQANALNYKTEGQKILELQNKANQEYIKALPLLEKTLELKPQDTEVKQALKNLYTKLGMTQKAAGL